MWCSSSSLCRSYTQLFISFTSSEFLTNIAILENIIDEICSRMSANLLMLNPSKTDFLLIGLPEQLYKLSNPIMNVTSDVTLSLVPEARNLGVLFDSIYLVLVTFRLLLRLVSYHFIS